MQKPKLNYSVPIVTEGRFATDELQRTFNELTNNLRLIGTGSPEGVVEAFQYSEYIDTTGSSGSIKYIKMQASIGGDTTMGWVLI